MKMHIFEPGGAVGLLHFFKTTSVAFCLVATMSAQADTYTGLVVGIADGDTVTVLDSSKQQHKVRLAGIDAPEKAQAFGNVSRQHLAGLVFQKQVTIEFDKLDRYQREVGKVIIGGKDANLEQIKAGLAWHYKKYQREQSQADQLVYADAETSAAHGRRGLWRDANPIPPWDYRKSKRGG